MFACSIGYGQIERGIRSCFARRFGLRGRKERDNGVVRKVKGIVAEPVMTTHKHTHTHTHLTEFSVSVLTEALSVAIGIKFGIGIVGL